MQIYAYPFWEKLATVTEVLCKVPSGNGDSVPTLEFSIHRFQKLFFASVRDTGYIFRLKKQKQMSNVPYFICQLHCKHHNKLELHEKRL